MSSRKLYTYTGVEDLQSLIILTDEEVAWLKSYDDKLYWYGLLGENSEGYFTFNDDTLGVVPLSESTVEELYRAFGPSICGCIDLEVLKADGEELDQWRHKMNSNPQ